MIRAIRKEVAKGLLLAVKSGESIVEDTALVVDAATGLLKTAPAATEKVDYISRTTKTVGAGETPEINVIPAAGSNIDFEITTTATTAVTQIGKVYQMLSSGVLDNTTVSGSANGFLVTEIKGDKLLAGTFI